MPKVLISDELSPRAVEIFKERGVEVDVQDRAEPDQLKAEIGKYDGLAIRSATKVTQSRARSREQSESCRPRRYRRRQCRHSRRDRARRHGDEHAFRQFDHHRRACDRADDGAGARAAGGRSLDPGRQMGKEPLHGRRAHGKTLGIIGCGNIGSIVADRALGLKMQVVGVRSVPVAGTRRRSRRREGRARRAASRAPISSRCTRR